MPNNFYLSKTFLKLTSEAQRAFMLAIPFSDDDGFFDQFSISHIYNIDLKIFDELHEHNLIAKHEDDISRILNIKNFKTVKADRYTPSIYCEKFKVPPLEFKKYSKSKAEKVLETANSRMETPDSKLETIDSRMETADSKQDLKIEKPAIQAVILAGVEKTAEGRPAENLQKERSKEKYNNIYKYNNNFFGKSENLFNKNQNSKSLLDPIPPYDEEQAEPPKEATTQTPIVATVQVAGDVEKPKKKIVTTKKAKKLTDGQTMGELAIFIDKHNQIHNTKRKAVKAMYGNWKTIRESYSVDEILKGYANACESSFFDYRNKKTVYWKDILKDNPIIFLRTRNEKGPVDLVGRFLEKPETAKAPQIASNNNFQNQRGADYYKNLNNAQ